MFFSRIWCVSILVALAVSPITSGARPRAHRPIRNSQSARPHASNPAPVAPFVPPAPIINPATFSWNIDKQGGFVMSLCADLHGRLFVGTEDKGVWMYDAAQPAGKEWVQFTTKDGLGDDTIYALTVDGHGRIWAGTNAHGVAVFNNRNWQTYDRVTGPLGCHVTALTTNPTDGSVWIGTEMGLARYDDHQGWRYWTRNDGLPSNQVSCLAFRGDGALFVGTDCHGIAVGTPHDDYRLWRTIAGPLRPANRGRGSGIPCALINTLLVTKSGKVFCGTNAGLAWSIDGGLSWSYARGADWVDRGTGTYNNGLADNAELCGIEIIPDSSNTDDSGKAISVAEPGVGRFTGPAGFTGGRRTNTTQAIDVSGIVRAAPQPIYRNGRTGTFSWTASHLTPSARYRISLHMAEFEKNGPGQRIFNVFASGVPVLDHIDIFKEAGGRNRALVRGFTAAADQKGELVLTFQGGQFEESKMPGALAEDYITSLAEDTSGHIFVGHQRLGLDELDAQTQLPTPSHTTNSTDYIMAMAIASNGVVISNYGAGLNFRAAKATKPLLQNVPRIEGALIAFPVAAPPPTAKSLEKLADSLANPKSGQKVEPLVTYLGADWATRGDWMGRYGRQHTILFAARSPFDHEIISDRGFRVAASLGPHSRADDSLRHWIHWLKTDDPRVLYDPVVGYRRESEADDHGEAYPTAYEGPDIWSRVTVPAGVHRLSLYFMNKDGHDGDNRFRDYLVEIKPDYKTTAEAQAAPSLAQARVHGFWEGEYLRFALRGPATYWVRVDKNASFNVILQAAMLDRVEPSGASFHQLAWTGGEKLAPPMVPEVTSQRPLTADQDRMLATAGRLWKEASNDSCFMKGDTELQHLWAYRTGIALSASDPLLTNWRWALSLWTADDRTVFQQNAALARQALLRKYPGLAKLED